MFLDVTYFQGKFYFPIFLLYFVNYNEKHFLYLLQKYYLIYMWEKPEKLPKKSYTFYMDSNSV